MFREKLNPIIAVACMITVPVIALCARGISAGAEDSRTAINSTGVLEYVNPDGENVLLDANDIKENRNRIIAVSDDYDELYTKLKELGDLTYDSSQGLFLTEDGTPLARAEGTARAKHVTDNVIFSATDLIAERGSIPYWTYGYDEWTKKYADTAKRIKDAGSGKASVTLTASNNALILPSGYYAEPIIVSGNYRARTEYYTVNVFDHTETRRGECHVINYCQYNDSNSDADHRCTGDDFECDEIKVDVYRKETRSRIVYELQG